MKYLILFIAAIFITSPVLYSQQKMGKKAIVKPADQIKQYWFVLLTTGPNTEADSASKAILFEKHMTNINSLYYDGVIKAAGPFGKNNNDWQGLFIFDCATREEAEQYVLTDAAIAAGLLSAEITPWYPAPIGSFTHGKPVKKP